MRLEELLRAVVAGLLVPAIALALATIGFREPSPRVQMLQVAHAYVGLLLIPAGLLYLLVHVATTVDFRRAWRRARGPRPPSRSAGAARAWPWIVATVLVTSAAVVFFMAPLLARYGGESAEAARGVRLELRYLLVVANASTVAIVGTSWLLHRHGLAPFNLRWLAAAAAAGCATSGFWVTIVPPKAYAHVDVVAVAHQVLGPLALALAGAHVWHARRAATRRASSDAAPPYRWLRPLLFVSLPIALLAHYTMVVLPHKHGGRFDRPSVDERMIRPLDTHFAEAAPDGCAPCHGGEAETWGQSAHAHAAANPVFEALLRRADREGRADVVRWCLGCHAPHALDPAHATIDEIVWSPGFRAGVHCFSCHRADDVSGAGDGALSFRPLAADRFLFIQDLPGPVADGIRRGYTPYALVASRLSLHRRAFQMRSRETALCRPCHVQTLAVPTGGRETHVLQDQFSSWQRSPAAARGETCASCHMPVYRNPFGVRAVDHRMLGASTFLAARAGGAPGLSSMTAWLSGQDTRRPRAPIDPAVEQRGPLIEMHAEIVGTPGERRLRVRSRNTGRIGHSFPNGPTDLFEIWLAARVADRGGARELVAVGADGPDGAPALGDRLYAAAGELVTDHDLWNVARVEDLGRIPEAGDHVLELALPPVDLEPPVTVDVAWRYRRLRPELTRSLTGASLDLPIVTVAHLAGPVPVGAASR